MEDIQHSKGAMCSKFGGEPCSCTCCQEITILEPQLLKMAEQLRKLKSQRNRTHSPINKYLPPEILSTIFMDCLATREELEYCYQHGCPVDFSPFQLGDVCRHWRDIAWSNPRLWCQFSCTLHAHQLRGKASLLGDLVRAWLDRSDSLPLSIQILMLGSDDYFYSNPDDDRYVDHPVIDIIKLYSQRWQNLHLRMWPLCISQMGDDIAEIPMLRTLKIWSLGRAQPSSLWKNVKMAPQTIHLRIDHMRLLTDPTTMLFEFRLDWGVLNDISVNDLGWRHYIQILESAPRLTRFSIKFGQQIHRSVSQAHKLIHSNLQYLKIHGNAWQPSETNALDGFLSTTTFLSLRELHYDVGYKDWSAIGSAPLTAHLPAAFLERHRGLQKLSIQISDFTEVHQFNNLLRRLPSLNHLSLIDRDSLKGRSRTRDNGGNTPQSGLLQVLCHLSGWNSDYPMGPADSVSLPTLRTFSYRAQNYEPLWEHILGILGPLSINNRYRRPLDAIHIALEYSARDVEDEEGLGRLREAKKAGVNFSLEYLN